MFLKSDCPRFSFFIFLNFIVKNIIQTYKSLFKMVSNDWSTALKQLANKPAVMKKFIKHCKPKDRKFGIAVKRCERCNRRGAHIKSYGLNLCRHCFREIAKEIGFKKYS